MPEREERVSQADAVEDILQLAEALAEAHPDPYTALGGPLAFHRRVVALQKREVVTEDQISRRFQFALRRPPQGSRGFVEPAQTAIVRRNTLIRRPVVQIQSKGFFGPLNSPLILAGAKSDPSS